MQNIEFNQRNYKPILIPIQWDRAMEFTNTQPNYINTY